MSDYIRRMAHVALEVPDLDASVAWATTVMGLTETERVAGVSYLTHADCHHSLQYIAADRPALHHVAMQAHDAAALDALRSRLEQIGIPILSTEAEEPALDRALRFRAPAGHMIEVFVGMQGTGTARTGAGVPPRKFGHPMLACEDPRATVAFLIDILGFRLSDDIGDGTLVFMRCNPDHHGIGVGLGPRAGLNHYAWGVENIGAIGQLGDVLARNGSRFIWGPGRHGAGQNIFTYHFDPAGCIVEYYADLYQVWDERTYEPGRWELDDPRFANLWGPGPPLEMMETATPLADR
ncbi:MAG TPA: VOC family protein [Solirubrobacteraceae bacterium]|nr:VOC family protein [Solirubrobacteraceae bacterium]